MKLNQIIFTGIGIICCMLLILTGCEYDKGFNDIWNENQDGAPAPIINDVTPDSLVEGNVVVTIDGQNFSSDMAQDFVYFDNSPGTVIAASETQLTVIRSSAVSGLVNIQVVVRDALYSATYGPYKLEPGIAEVGTDLGRVYSIALDKDENLYVHKRSDKKIYKIALDGTQTEYGTISEADATSVMRMGPDGYLYLQRNTSSDGGFRRLYRMAPGGGEAERYVQVGKAVKAFDFDSNLNIYLSGLKSGVYMVKPDLSITFINMYSEFDVNAIRVFDGDIYFAGQYQGDNPLYNADSSATLAVPDKQGIWKNKILSDGTLGNIELVFDWATTGNYSDSEINDITLSDSGEIMVGTAGPTNVPVAGRKNPVLIIHTDGTIETLYEDLLSAPATKLVWGNYLFIARHGDKEEDSGVTRVIMSQKSAPYYGRQ